MWLSLLTTSALLAQLIPIAQPEKWTYLSGEQLSGSAAQFSRKSVISLPKRPTFAVTIASFAGLSRSAQASRSLVEGSYFLIVSSRISLTTTFYVRGILKFKINKILKRSPVFYTLQSYRQPGNFICSN